MKSILGFPYFGKVPSKVTAVLVENALENAAVEAEAERLQLKQKIKARAHSGILRFRILRFRVLRFRGFQV